LYPWSRQEVDFGSTSNVSLSKGVVRFLFNDVLFGYLVSFVVWKKAYTQLWGMVNMEFVCVLLLYEMLESSYCNRFHEWETDVMGRGRREETLFRFFSFLRSPLLIEGTLRFVLVGLWGSCGSFSNPRARTSHFYQTMIGQRYFARIWTFRVGN